MTDKYDAVHRRMIRLRRELTEALDARMTNLAPGDALTPDWKRLIDLSNRYNGAFEDCINAI